MSAVFDNNAWDAFSNATGFDFGTESCTVTAPSGAVYSAKCLVERRIGPRALPTGQVIDADITILLIQSTATPNPEPKRGWRITAGGVVYAVESLISPDQSALLFSVKETV